jgi:hypothetical protein
MQNLDACEGEPLDKSMHKVVAVCSSCESGSYVLASSKE